MHLSHFVKQKPAEHVIFILRRHWITFLSTIVVFIILAALPFGVAYGAKMLFPEMIWSESAAYPVIVLIGSLYCLFTLLFFYIRFIDYYLDLWIVTNERIVDIAQEGLFARNITEFELGRIQDVTTNVHGVLNTILHFGNLVVTTASSTNSIIFHQISNPDHVREELIRLAAEYRKRHQDEPDVE